MGRRFRFGMWALAGLSVVALFVGVALFYFVPNPWILPVLTLPTALTGAMFALNARRRATETSEAAETPGERKGSRGDSR